MSVTNEKAPSGLASEMELLSGRPLSRKEESTIETQSIQAVSAESYYETDKALLEKKFAPRKKESEELADVYGRISSRPECGKTMLVVRSQFNENAENGELYTFSVSEKKTENYWSRRASRVNGCGTYLEIGREIISGVPAEKGKLHKANFCRDRLCPMCQKRRSLKFYGQTSKIMDVIGDKFKFIFVTLTIPNVPANGLTRALNGLTTGFDRFLRYKPIEKVCKGCVRALEVTYNPERDDYHPHLHVIFAVPKSYAKSKDYIKHEDWLKMWQRAYGDNRISQVNVKAITGKEEENGKTAAESLKKAVAEVCKYSVTSKSLLFEDKALSEKVVLELAMALARRRLVQFRGVFQKAAKALKLEDVESPDVDLTHLDGYFRPDVALMICQYSWTSGAYVKTDEYILEPTKGENET